MFDSIKIMVAFWQLPKCVSRLLSALIGGQYGERFFAKGIAEDSGARFGGVAQLGEHLPCKQGVRSSILLVSTITWAYSSAG